MGAAIAALVGISVLSCNKYSCRNIKATVATLSGWPGRLLDDWRKSVANFEFAKTGSKISGVKELTTALVAR